ncbi:MAG TPA: GTP cyclohydrolase I FolE [Candidatus Avimonoglobus intestinipullorum]|uniref:GTP cyclohydrolase 1 n=1 Tax=Candidatus Avimonoglobus intestinipullorum TaxID=2840699 RepID=A0A9D1S5N4_9FIRM|nr:GTP cyclohydrolase I FolE [Candidatus Avimonoglobus intestinipullorum]
MKKEFNQKKIQELIKALLAELGDDPEREGLRETPARVARMYAEVFEGMRYTNAEIAQMFCKCFEDVDTNDLVLVKDIEVFSFCEHHLALMYNMKVHVGYIPNGKVIGLSKIARIADMAAKRLQLQERLGCDIAEIMQMVLGTEDVIVIIEGEHSCMTARGIKSRGAKTRTAAIRGLFDTDHELRNEVYNLLR